MNNHYILKKIIICSVCFLVVVGQRSVVSRIQTHYNNNHNRDNVMCMLNKYIMMLVDYGITAQEVH